MIEYSRYFAKNQINNQTIENYEILTYEKSKNVKKFDVIIIVYENLHSLSITQDMKTNLNCGTINFERKGNMNWIREY